MHRLKFDDGVEPENVLLAYYNSVSFAFTEICGRSYGGGVLEILPGKMGNILIPKIQQIDPAFRSELLQEIDHVVRNDDDIEKVLNLVDREIFTKLLGINQDICSQCRIIWKNENEKIRAGINSAAEVYLQEVDESIGFFTEYLFLELSDTNLLITYCLKIASHSPASILLGRLGCTTKLTSTICSINASASCSSLYSSSSRYRGITW